jgi:hypothetical protein
MEMGSRVPSPSTLEKQEQQNENTALSVAGRVRRDRNRVLVGLQ